MTFLFTYLNCHKKAIFKRKQIVGKSNRSTKSRSNSSNSIEEPSNKQGLLVKGGSKSKEYIILKIKLIKAWHFLKVNIPLLQRDSLLRKKTQEQRQGALSWSIFLIKRTDKQKEKSVQEEGLQEQKRLVRKKVLFLPQ